MEQFLCITLKQDVPDFNNIMKVKESSPRTPRFLAVELEVKEIPSRVTI